MFNFLCSVIHKNKSGNSKRGFTLVELVVTIALVMIVAGTTVAIVFLSMNVFNQSSGETQGQYNTNIMEKWMNTSISTASDIQIKTVSGSQFIQNYVHGEDGHTGDRVIYIDPTSKQLCVAELDAETGLYSIIFRFDGVRDAEFVLSQIEASQKIQLNYNLDAYNERSTSPYLAYRLNGGLVANNMTAIKTSTLDMSVTTSEPSNSLGAFQALVIYYPHEEITDTDTYIEIDTTTDTSTDTATDTSTDTERNTDSGLDNEYDFNDLLTDPENDNEYRYDSDVFG